MISYSIKNNEALHYDNNVADNEILSIDPMLNEIEIKDYISDYINGQVDALDIIIDNYKDYLIYYAHQNVQPGLSEDVRCVERLTEKGFYKQNYIDITQDYLDDAPYYLLGRMKYNTSHYEGKEIEENSVIILKHILKTKIGSRFIECSIEVEDILY